MLKPNETICPNCDLETWIYTLRCRVCGYIRNRNINYLNPTLAGTIRPVGEKSEQRHERIGNF